MHSIKLIAGLGNPGRKHEKDRHNVGFWFVSRLASNGFWRLRMGIGHRGDKNLVGDYVLMQPPAAERELIETALTRCLDVAGLLVEGDMQAAMLKLHTTT